MKRDYIEKLLMNAAFVVSGCLFIIMFTQISFSLPFNEYDIPITGQSFAVLFIAFILRWYNSVLSVVLYLLLGILGLPVFANLESGFIIIQGISGGFLYGFIVAAFATSKIAELKIKNNFLHALLALFVGTIVIFLFGLMHILIKDNLANALKFGLIPFIPGALIKIVVGALLLTLYARLKVLSNKIY